MTLDIVRKMRSYMGSTLRIEAKRGTCTRKNQICKIEPNLGNEFKADSRAKPNSKANSRTESQFCLWLEGA